MACSAVSARPGFIMSVTAFLRDNPDPTEEELRDGLSGNLCRCTGYQGIIKAAQVRGGGNPPAARRKPVGIGPDGSGEAEGSGNEY